MKRLAAYLARLAKPLAVGFGLAAMSVAAPAHADGIPRNCTGKFVNPISDVCWECLAPITLGNVKLYNKKGKKDFGNPGSPICACTTPFPRIGLAVGFWEPVRLADVTRAPWCLVNLGGMELDPGIGYSAKPKASSAAGANLDAQHVHWYIYPLMYWLELLTDFLCLEAQSFDVSYVTELDPLWNDDGLSLLIHPEAGLFANIPAQMACAADCAISSTGLARPEMFWCMGCNGSSYPMTGNMTSVDTEGESSLLAAERMAYKLHRTLVAWGTSGEKALCQKYPMPVMDKRQYRWQLVNPRPITRGPFTCPTTGASTYPWEHGVHFPGEGKDYGYLIWRKRNCCAL